MHSYPLDYQTPKHKIAGPCPHKPAETRCLACIMDTSYYFSDLTVEAKRDLQQYLQLKTFNRKDFLYEEGQSCKNLYILISGDVKLYKSMPDSKFTNLYRYPVI